MSKTILQVWRDGREWREDLLPGDAGVIQTLDHMARFVREDSAALDVRRFLHREVLKGVRPFDRDAYIQALFGFAQKSITWRPDPVGVERVSDVWTTLNGLESLENYSPEGDCGVKSVFLATALACFQFVPYFAVIQQHAGQDTFSHVFVALSHGGKTLHLDPTPEERALGWHAQYYRRAYRPIFE